MKNNETMTTKIGVISKEEMPKQDHWAILQFTSYVTDDGYPENGTRNQPFVKYTAFLDETEWKKELETLAVSHHLYGNGCSFTGIFVRVAKIKVEAKVEF